MKYCAYPACQNKIAKGLYCSEHQRRKKKRAVSKNKSFYRTTVWKDLRTAVYVRDGGRCVHCNKFVFGKDAQVHHKEAIWKRPDLKLNENNCELVCAECHPKIEEKPPTSKKFNFDFWG